MPQEMMKVDYETEQGAQLSLDGATVRNYLVKGNGNVTDGEVLMFLHRCRDMRLDPFSSDVSLVKYGSDQPASIIVGKDAFVKRADAHPEFDGMEYGIVAMAADGTMSRREGAMTVPGEKLVGGWAKVWRKDRTRPSTAEVALAEYDTGRNSWRKMPATMIAKVAKSQALREAFPNVFAGLYEAEEMQQAEQPPAPSAPVEAAPAPEPSASTRHAQEELGRRMRSAQQAGVSVAAMKQHAVDAYGRSIEEMNAVELSKMSADVAAMEKAACAPVEVEAEEVEL